MTCLREGRVSSDVPYEQTKKWRACTSVLKETVEASKNVGARWEWRVVC